ncbi:MAG: ATP-grasp domain-containing protein [Ignavibacteriales bacterium]|nr:ATP-grasp domain-containing protein [Ignavibacteriales bacterium]
MRKKINVAVIYNEPVTQKDSEIKFVTATGELLEAHGVQNGSSSHTDLSEVGVLEERTDIANALQSVGYKSSIFNVDSNIMRLIDYLNNNRPDVIFNLCESVGNEAIHEMHVAGMYELMGIPYTGAGPLALGIALNKVRVKEILLSNGLPTPRYQLIESPIKITLDENMNFPLIVKPAREDASVGISSDSVVYSLSDMKKRVRFIFEQFNQPALVEEYIDGRELNVAILGNKKAAALPISEIDMSTLPKQYHRIISYNAKWMKGTEEYEHTRGVCPAKLSPELEATMKEMALKAFYLVGCRDYARIDFRLTSRNKPYILEVNPNPDISDDAGFARSGRAAGYKFEELISKIVELAIERTSS